jgi:predicted ATPase
MKLRKVTLQNVRSFSDQQELILDGDISILIGPNGGGKTNLLDAVVIFLRRFLFASVYANHAPIPENQERYELRPNNALENLKLEKHTANPGLEQTMQIEVEVTASDLNNMRLMKETAAELLALCSTKYINAPMVDSTAWNLDTFNEGQKLSYTLVGGKLAGDGSPEAHVFRQYLNYFEINNFLRQEYELSKQLSVPILYLPVSRGTNSFQSSVALADFNDYEQKRQIDATWSKSGTQVVTLAVGRLAQKYRLLLEKDKGTASKEFQEDDNLKQLSEALKDLGYAWSLKPRNPLKNQYDVRLEKQGKSFLVQTASSGELELLTYLFAIFALNVRDALIIVDEPELHLHPKWQKTLLQMFIRLSKTTGNQFLLATHSPTFVGPESIQYVSRVFSRDQRSRIERLNNDTLPDERHLFNIINSQNNERLFFADKVVLVEGLSDRIFFDAVLDAHGRAEMSGMTIEVIAVGGKHFFNAYRNILRACRIEHALIADLDYLEQIGTSVIKALFDVDFKDIKKDAIDNMESSDGDALVRNLEKAIQTGNLDELRATWKYIKSRRCKLRPNLSTEQQETLNRYIEQQRQEAIFILRQGKLEDYLPEGYKNLDSLIRLAGGSDFWAKLDIEAQEELAGIVTALLGRKVAKING